MKTFIRNEYGSVIGEIEDIGTKITYRSFKTGIVGYYEPSRKRYTRLKAYGGHLTYPQNEHDYGFVDILHWEGWK